MNNAKILARHTFFLGLLSTNLIVGFLLNVIFVSNIGTGVFTDLLFLSISISSMVIMLFTSGVNNYLISELSNLTSEEKRKRLQSIFTLYFSLSLLFLFFLFIWWCLFSHFNVFMVIMLGLLTALFTAGGSVFNAYYYSERKQHQWELINAVFGTVTVAIAYNINYPHKYAVIIASLLLFFKSFAPFIINCILCRIYPLTNNIKIIKKELRRIISIIGFSIYYKSEPFWDRLILSGGVGFITYYHISSQLYNTASILWSKISTSPLISKCANNVEDVGFIRKKWTSNVMFSIIISVCASLIFFCVSNFPFLKEFEFYKKIKDYIYVINIMLFYGCTQIIGQAVSSYFYINKKYKAPIYISAVNFTIFMPIKYIAFLFYKLEGFVFVTTLYHLANVIIMLLVKRKYDKG
ncbi:hypothetical protein [Pectobacterium carotovorum]|uniref:hypothetical protein n=1 Tax=Pectobacterium carotovorum TaxID=554 RepID=UPI002A7F57D3|nr:hypothetical protein [Pectobacterium carotovorum]MDY4376081.1 hypothetical protein [Pectobacterium carotovorum subsp. carotovorum]